MKCSESSEVEALKCSESSEPVELFFVGPTSIFNESVSHDKPTTFVVFVFFARVIKVQAKFKKPVQRKTADHFLLPLICTSLHTLYNSACLSLDCLVTFLRFKLCNKFLIAFKNFFENVFIPFCVIHGAWNAFVHSIAIPNY